MDQIVKRPALKQADGTAHQFAFVRMRQLPKILVWRTLVSPWVAT